MILLILSGLILGCGSEKATLMESKLDPSLRQKLTELQARSGAETLAIFGKCAKAIDTQMRKELSDAGATVETVTGDIFTARVPSEKIAKLSNVDFVKQLQLSQTSYPLPK